MWRHQMQALAEAGFRAVAPDQRGYGQTDVPEAVEEYTYFHLVGDIVGLLDALGEQQVSLWWKINSCLEFNSLDIIGGLSFRSIFGSIQFVEYCSLVLYWGWNVCLHQNRIFRNRMINGIGLFEPVNPCLKSRRRDRAVYISD